MGRSPLATALRASRSATPSRPSAMGRSPLAIALQASRFPTPSRSSAMRRSSIAAALQALTFLKIIKSLQVRTGFYIIREKRYLFISLMQFKEQSRSPTPSHPSAIRRSPVAVLQASRSPTPSHPSAKGRSPVATALQVSRSIPITAYITAAEIA